MRYKLKTKFKPNEEVIVKNFPQPGWVSLGRIDAIEIKVDRFGRVSYNYTVHIMGWGSSSLEEARLLSIKEFEKEQKVLHLNYSSYIKWVNEQNFSKIEK